MKLHLKPPGTKRLNLNIEILLSISASKSNLRRYPGGLEKRVLRIALEQPPLCVPRHLVWRPKCAAQYGRGLHSSTFRLNVGAFCRMEGAPRGSSGGV